MLLRKNREQCNIWLVVIFATFAIFAFRFVASWFAFVKFASFGKFVILARAHFGVADNILANFAIFVAYLELPFLIYPYADPRFLPGTLTCAKFKRIKIEASKVDK